MIGRTYIKDLGSKVEETVTVMGWVDARRDHGKLVFLDLRDRTGKIQIVCSPQEAPKAHQMAEMARSEWILEVSGVVKERPANMAKLDVLNGNLELKVADLKVINEAETPPFDLTTDGYEVKEEVRLKYRYLDLRRPRLVKNLTHRHKIIKFFRDYLSDQGFIEIETPLLTKSSPEGARDYIVPARLDPGKFYALPQSPQQYKQLLMVAGIERYFQVAKCLRDEDTRGDRQAEFTQLDLEMSFFTQADILDLIEEMCTKMIKALYPEKQLTFEPWPRLDYETVMTKYQSDKPDLRKDKNNPNELAFVWILNFPLFEPEKVDGHYAPSHHMFTAPKESDLAKLDSDPSQVKSYQHDLALNGFEIGGGSIRIHDPRIQSKIFDLIGFQAEQKAYFEHMLTAFRYGVPPHGGIAVGLDRLLALLENEPNIREVIAFPKTGEGRDLMMGAPAEVEKEQLDALGIEIKKTMKVDRK